MGFFVAKGKAMYSLFTACQAYFASQEELIYNIFEMQEVSLNSAVVTPLGLLHML